MSIKCPQCKFNNNDAATHCIVCGKELAINVPTPGKRPATKNISAFQQFLEGTELRGKVIEIQPPYYMKPEFNMGKPILILGILCIALFILSQNLILLILVGGAILLIGAVMSFLHIPVMFIAFEMIMMQSRGSGRGDVQVRDVVIQDSDGNHLVRIMGQLTIGNISKGDSITAKGRMKKGMLIFRSGYNHTINTALKAKT
jgi:hypothetical protein